MIQAKLELGFKGRKACPTEAPMKHESGFTLIELLLVLAVIGIISAVAIPALLGQREASRQKATVATAAAVVAETTAALQSQTNATHATVMAYVRALRNFAYPACKNAYKPTASPLTTAWAAAGNGQVGLVATTQTDTNGNTQTVIAISYQHAASGGPKVLANILME